MGEISAKRESLTVKAAGFANIALQQMTLIYGKGFCKIEVRHTFEKKKSSFYFFFFKTKRIKLCFITNYKANSNYF